MFDKIADFLTFKIAIPTVVTLIWAAVCLALIGFLCVVVEALYLHFIQ